jgi:hypothetical protein
LVALVLVVCWWSCWLAPTFSPVRARTRVTKGRAATRPRGDGVQAAGGGRASVTGDQRAAGARWANFEGGELVERAAGEHNQEAADVGLPRFDGQG